MQPELQLPPNKYSMLVIVSGIVSAGLAIAG